MTRLSSAARDVMVGHIRHYGRDRVESGGFLVAGADGAIEAVALTGGSGIVRAPGLFKISGGAVDQLFGWCETRGLRAAAMFHSHEHAAFLSPTDRRSGLNIVGFTSVVLPTFAAPPDEPEQWAWFRYDEGDWSPTAAWTLVDRAVLTVTFDEEGVHG